MAVFDGTNAADYLTGNPVADTISGLEASDTIQGFGGNDSINGNQASDSVAGNQGDDSLRGGQGNDTLYGGKNNDLLLGDLDDDFLFGDVGTDILWGGDGNDIFVIAQGGGGSTVESADRIKDFRGDGTGGSARDLIGLIEKDKDVTLEQLFNQLHIFLDGANTIIQDRDSGEYLAVLENFSDRTLTLADFNLVRNPLGFTPPGASPSPSPEPTPSPSPTPGTPSPTPSNVTVSVTATDGTAAESGNPATDTGTFRFTRTGSTSAALTVNYTIGGSATNGTDYDSLSGSVTIPAGSNAATVVVKPVDDTLDEDDETVTVTVNDTSNYDVGASNTATVTIQDNDAPAPVTISATATDGAENGAVKGVFTLTRTGDTTNALEVDYTLGGTATAGDDYTNPATGTVTFAAGAATATLDINTIDDDTPNEPTNETVTLALAGFTLSGDDTLTLADNDGDDATNDLLTGTAAANVLAGGNGDDTINGGAGNDTLLGGGGNDSLFGGSGADAFRYTSAAEGGDTIADFATGTDKFQFANSAFGNLGVGALSAAEFAILANYDGSTGAPNGTGAAFIFDTATVELIYDSNGTTAGGTAVIATLQGAGSVAIGDIAIVAG